MSAAFDTDEFNQKLYFPPPPVESEVENAADHFVEVPFGQIHLRQHRTPTAHIRLLYFYGNGEVVGAYDSLAPKFAEAGAELWVADYRGYGHSSGVPTLRNQMSDAHLVAEHLNGDYVVMGRSLGSVSAIELYGARPAHLKGVVIASGIGELRGLIRRRGMPVPETFDAETLATFDPLPKMRRGIAPLMVMHGSKDEVIAPSEAQLLFEAAGTEAAKKSLVWLEGFGHNDVMTSPKYWSALRDFLGSLKSDSQ